MGRQKEFDEAEAIEAAMLVFWQVGFESASLPELLDAMGLSKSSFYHSFGSKEALFERCLGAYADKLVRSLREQLDRSESGLAFLRSVLFSVGEETRDNEKTTTASTQLRQNDGPRSMANALRSSEE